MTTATHCQACGAPWVNHLGIAGTCATLLRTISYNERLVALLRRYIDAECSCHACTGDVHRDATDLLAEMFPVDNDCPHNTLAP